MSKIRVKLRCFPEGGIAGLEEYTDTSNRHMLANKCFINYQMFFWDFDHHAFTDQRIQRQRLDLRGAFNKMRGSVDVRSGVRAEVHDRNISAVAVGKAAPFADLNPRI